MIDYTKLEKFTGEWVLILRDEVVDHSSDVEKILKGAEKYSDEEITLYKVPQNISSTLL